MTPEHHEGEHSERKSLKGLAINEKTVVPITLGVSFSVISFVFWLGLQVNDRDYRLQILEAKISKVETDNKLEMQRVTELLREIQNGQIEIQVHLAKLTTKYEDLNLQRNGK